MEMKNRSVYEDNSGSAIPFERQFKTVSSEAIETVPLNKNAEPFTSPPQTMILWTQLLAATAISMVMLLNGFTVGYGYRAISSIFNSPSNQHSFQEPTEIKESLSVGSFKNRLKKLSYRALFCGGFLFVAWVGSSVPLAASVGGLLGEPIITYVGRKYSLIGAGLPFFISWILVASASNLHLLIAGRVLSGICIGVTYSAFPVYIVETVQPELRGALGLLPIAFRNGGILLAYLAGAYLDISTMAYIAAALSVPFFSLMFVPPESPRWYIAKGRTHNAREALQWLRGKTYNIKNEMEDITQCQIEADKTKGIALKQMLYMENFPAVLISLGLMIFQQLTGMYVVMFYYLRNTASIINFESLNIKIGIVGVLSVIIAIILVDIVGRKILLYISSGCVIVSLLTLGVFSYIQESDDNISFGSLLQVCLTLYFFGSFVGYECIPWLMLGEILPLKIRGTAASLITGITWLCTFYMGTSSINMLKSDTMYGFFFAFAVIHVVAILFVIFCVPETRGKSLEEIEIYLKQRVKIMNNRGDANADANII